MWVLGDLYQCWDPIIGCMSLRVHVGATGSSFLHTLWSSLGEPICICLTSFFRDEGWEKYNFSLCVGMFPLPRFPPRWSHSMPPPWQMLCECLLSRRACWRQGRRWRGGGGRRRGRGGSSPLPDHQLSLRNRMRWEEDCTYNSATVCVPTLAVIRCPAHTKSVWYMIDILACRRVSDVGVLFVCLTFGPESPHSHLRMTLLV